MSQIIPIKELRDTNKISELCNAINEPIFVTKNGYGDMVVMSMAAYEERLARLDMYAKIMEGRAQAEKGEVVDGKTFFKGLREKYGR